MVAGDQQQELIGRASSGDRAALEQLLLIHSSQLKQHIQQNLPASVQRVIGVDDVVQMTLMQAFRDIRDLNSTLDRPFRAWLRIIADHRLQDTIRILSAKKRGGGRRQVTQLAEGHDSSVVELVETLGAGTPTASSSAACREAIQAVRVGIAALPDDQRRAIRLHVLEGKSLAETARAMDRSADAVRGLIHRARQRLRDALIRSSLWLSQK